jgi:MFS transporter, ACS family, tartrate transporter
MSDDRVFTKCAWRLIPFMMLLYLVNFIDRLNVGFAALTMNKDLDFSPTMFGFGAGIFFLGYVLFQVPSNIILERVGARRWIFCILAIWGLISASTAFVTGPTGFYVLRFLLGLCESGFFPGMIFYLTLWFPKAYRARHMANFALAVPLSGIVGGPLSGFILGLDGLAQLHGWQWLFLLEGLPAFLLAFAVLKFMPDGPGSAPWLSDSEKSRIAESLAAEADAEDGDLWQAFYDWRYWAMGLVGILTTPTNYGIALWLPQIVQEMGFSNFATGFVVALAYLASMGAMIFVSRSSDRKCERIWHYALPMLFAAAGFLIASITQNYLIELFALSAAMAGFLAGGYGPYYSHLSALSTGKTAAAGIALTNSILIVGGFVGPYVIGIIKDQTGGYSAAMTMLAAGLILAALLFLTLGRMMVTRAAVRASVA